MDASYLSQQVNTIIGQLHGLFDEIGVANHDRENREAEVGDGYATSCTSFYARNMLISHPQLFSALSETLHNQVKIVAAEKKEMVDEANRIITIIRQMDASLDDTKSQRSYHPEDDELKITFPLSRCLTVLKDKHTQISRLHRERFEQVKSMFLSSAMARFLLHSGEMRTILTS
jgi:protein regulator of cytokinesis 1